MEIPCEKTQTLLPSEEREENQEATPKQEALGLMQSEQEKERRRREKQREYCKRWREKYPEKAREACNRWIRAHPEKVTEVV